MREAACTASLPMSPPPKWIAYASAALLWAGVSSSPAATVISGLDPLFDTGSPDGWSGISVLMTPIAAPGDGSTEGVVTTFNFWAENGRADGGHRVTPLLLEFSGGSYKVIGIGTERAPTSAGAKSEPFGLVAGTDQVDLTAGVDYVIGVLQQADGVDDSNAGLIPFAGGGGSGVFQMNVAGPDHDPALDDVITAGHTSNAGGRNYAFNMEIDFASDPQPPSDIELAAGEIFPGMPPGTEFGTLSTTDPNSNDTHTYALVSNPGGVFAIDGDRLSLAMAPGAAGTSYAIRVRSTDGDALSFEKEFDITVAAALPPTDITLSASSVTSGLPAGGLVGMLASVDANAGDSHVYTLAAGSGDFDNASFAVSGAELRLAAPVPEGRSSLSLRLRSTDLSGAWLEKAFVLAVTDPSVRINEFVASNVGLLGDEDGDTPDWIELFNEQSAAVNLGGWFLTDDPDDLAKWQIPPVSLGPSGYLVVFASGKGRAVAGAELHTNFQLSASGDFLALVKPDGETVADQFVFGQQFPDIAFGYSGGAGGQGFLTPTPSAANGEAFAEARNEVSFSHPRGHYESAFDLTLSPLLPGSTIRYTTDGSKPSASSNGTVYSGPITVSPDTGGTRRGSRIIRAVALGGDAAIEKVATHTYLFVNGAVSPATDGVVNQGNLASSIKNHATYGPLLDDALLALPTVSIAGGLPGSTESERSLEFFVPDGTEPGFQLDAGLKVVGGHSVSSPKNNFRVYIRGQYGQSSLSYPLFEDHPYSDRAAETFNRLNLRSGSHDSFFWLASAGNPPNSGGPQKGDAQYLRNRWINDMQLAMGHESQHGRYVQLYVNGEYRGQYQIHEWPNDDFTASYLGGEASDYEVYQRGEYCEVRQRQLAGDLVDDEVGGQHQPRGGGAVDRLGEPRGLHAAQLLCGQPVGLEPEPELDGQRAEPAGRQRLDLPRLGLRHHLPGPGRERLGEERPGRGVRHHDGLRGIPGPVPRPHLPALFPRRGYSRRRGRRRCTICAPTRSAPASWPRPPAGRAAG